MVARWTPRQLEAVSQESKRQIEGATGETDEPTTPSTNGTPEAQQQLPGAQGVRGMGLHKYDCWKPYPGENDADPFSVPREIVKERWYALLYEACRQGGLEAHGVARDNMDGLRDLFDRTWAENCEKFEKLKQERDHGIREENAGSGGDASP